VLLEKVEAFWGLVQKRTPPEPDGSDSAKEALKSLYPRANGTTIQLPPESGEWSEQYQTVSAEVRELMKAKTEAANRLCAAIGDASFGISGDGSRWSYREQKRNGFTVQPSTTRVLRRLAK
jgi:predicted phage-related endonuclease